MPGPDEDDVAPANGHPAREDPAQAPQPAPGDNEPPIPAPGSPAALAHGCRCPTLANEPQAGFLEDPLIAPDCPVHTPSSP